MWRRMEKISLSEKITNEGVLKRVGEERQLMNITRCRKKIWLWHVLRGDGLLRKLMEGRTEGKRSRGMPRNGMLDDLMVGTYGDITGT